MEPVALNPLDCNLDFLLSEGNLVGSTCSDGGLAYMWSGARGSAGVTGASQCTASSCALAPARCGWLPVNQCQRRQAGARGALHPAPPRPHPSAPPLALQPGATTSR
jgi:hypothetical protein